jgi:hypothetical protein
MEAVILLWLLRKLLQMEIGTHHPITRQTQKLKLMLLLLRARLLLAIEDQIMISLETAKNERETSSVNARKLSRADAFMSACKANRIQARIVSNGWFPRLIR